MLPSLCRSPVLHNASTSLTISNRGLRKYYERGFLKDLWNRRILAGAEPLSHRAFLPNWSYPSELYAFRHRINGDDKENENFIKALTNPTFFSRKDVLDNASGAQPVLDTKIDSLENNINLAQEGHEMLKAVVTGYFSLQFPNAPMEFIDALTKTLIHETTLAEAATALGMQHLVRTGEFPPFDSTLAEAFKSVLTVLSPERGQKTILENVITKAVSIPLEDVMPFKNPLEVLTDYAKKMLNATSVEPRIMHQSGLNAATPLFYVGIFADQKLIGECAGETLATAVDLASQAALLNLWGVSQQTPLAFVDYSSKDLSKVKENHSLYDVVGKNTDVSLYSHEELNYDPLDIVQMANNYHSLERQIGIPRIKRLRHKFSRGSLFKRTFRYLVKPRPYSI